MLSQLFCVLLVTSFAVASKDVQRVVDTLLGGNYDRRIRPDAGVKPTDVKLEAFIKDVYNFDEIKHQVTLNMYFRQKWTDKRLTFNPDEVKGAQYWTLDNDQIKKMWIPDTFIVNDRSVSQHNFPHPNEYTRLYFNGNITRSMKLTITVGCALNLRWFPFDQNLCAIDFESYGHTADDVRYLWGRNNATGELNIAVSYETAQSVRHTIVALNGRNNDEQVASGSKYSKAVLELFFKRLSFRYLLDVYFPATAIPVVSFITLCVGPLHFRVLLSTICMGIMVLYSAILMLLTPKVNYKTALDFYVFNSSVTVFNVLLVNFLMYYLLKPKPAPTQIRMRQINGSSEEGKGILVDEDSAADDPSAAGTSTAPPRFPNKTYEVLYKLSEKSYLTMPIFFVVFNLIYWPVVLIASSWTPEDFVLIEPSGVW